MAVGLRLPLFCMILALSAAAITAAAPAPAVDCSSLVLNMADCLSYVTVGGTAKKPANACCSGLKTVLKTDADCLCEAFKNSAQFGVTLNVSKALTLPDACHVSGPSVSNCARKSLLLPPLVLFLFTFLSRGFWVSIYLSRCFINCPASLLWVLVCLQLSDVAEDF